MLIDLLLILLLQSGPISRAEDVYHFEVENVYVRSGPTQCDISVSMNNKTAWAYDPGGKKCEEFRKKLTAKFWKQEQTRIELDRERIVERLQELTSMPKKKGKDTK